MKKPAKNCFLVGLFKNCMGNLPGNVLFVQCCGNVNGYGNCAAYHRVVTYAKEAHHLNVGRN